MTKEKLEYKQKAIERMVKISNSINYIVLYELQSILPIEDNFRIETIIKNGYGLNVKVAEIMKGKKQNHILLWIHNEDIIKNSSIIDLSGMKLFHDAAYETDFIESVGSIPVNNMIDKYPYIPW